VDVLVDAVAVVRTGPGGISLFPERCESLLGDEPGRRLLLIAVRGAHAEHRIFDPRLVFREGVEEGLQLGQVGGNRRGRHEKKIQKFYKFTVDLLGTISTYCTVLPLPVTISEFLISTRI
jgi:hypothetical protein